MKSSRTLHAVLFLLSIAVAAQLPTLAAVDAGTLSLSLRKRVETRSGSGRFHTIVQPAKWDAKKTAIIVCDMWDSHHCLNAVRRVGEMAPRMNRLLSAARQHGVLIIHAPSECMDAYKNHPARQNAVKTPRSRHLPKDIGSWCKRIPAEEKGVYPIDQSDGGEDDDPVEHRGWAEKLQKMGRNPKAPWKSQIDVLKIEDRDLISDRGEEIWSILEERGIDNVILFGVHTNMCVLGRPFGLRQMAKNGKNVVLMRDLTDTMYNPARAPFVSHFTGTDLIVEHIEKWVSPTITSDQILGDKPFHFSGDKRPHLVLIMAEGEYQTSRTLPEFALKHLGKDFRVSTVYGSETDAHDLPGLDVLNEADVALVSVRRRALPTKQMDIIHKYRGQRETTRRYPHGEPCVFVARQETAGGLRRLGNLRSGRVGRPLRQSLRRRPQSRDQSGGRSRRASHPVRRQPRGAARQRLAVQSASAGEIGKSATDRLDPR